MACWSASRQRVVIAAWLVLQGFTKPVRGITNDFSAYPTNSQACIYLASSQGKCNSASSVTGLNECLCTNNSGFITKAAACVGQQDPSDLGEVYTVMSDACAYTNIDIALSRSEFLSAAAAASSSSSSASSTSSTSSSSALSTSTTSSITRSSSTLSKSTTSSSVGSTATNSANASGTNTTSSQPTETSGASANTDDSLGISSTAKIGIISGACVAGVTIMSAAALFIFRYRRNRRPAEESAPMLSLAGFAGGSSNAGVGGGGSGGSGNGGNGGSGGSGGSGGVGLVEIPGISEVPGSIGHSELPGGHTYWKAAEGVGANAKWHQAAGMNQIPHQQQEIFELPAHQDSSPYAEMPAREEPTPYAELSAQRHSTSPWVEMPASSVEDGVPMSTIVTPVSAKSEEGNSYAGTSYANSVVYEDLKEDWPAPAYRP